MMEISSGILVCAALVECVGPWCKVVLFPIFWTASMKPFLLSSRIFFFGIPKCLIMGFPGSQVSICSVSNTRYDFCNSSYCLSSFYINEAI